jgi:hypothetical protein
LKEKTLWLRRPDLNQRFGQYVFASEGKGKAKSAGGQNRTGYARLFRAIADSIDFVDPAHFISCKPPFLARLMERFGT